MTTTIKLDTQAMNSLFPEGSEARVKLQSAVISNFASKAFPKHLDEHLMEQIEAIVSHKVSSMDGKAIDDGIKQALENYFNMRFHGLNLTHQGRDRIKAHVKDSVENTLRSSIYDVANEEAKNLHQEIKHQIQEIAPVYLNQFKGEQLKALIRSQALKMVENAAKNI